MVAVFRFRLVYIIATAVMVSGCAGMLHTPYRGDAAYVSAVGGASELAVFDYAPIAQSPALQRLPDVHPNYEKFLIEFADVEGHGAPALDMSAHYYRSKADRVSRLVIVLPIWGSYPYPPKRITQTLLRRSKGDFDVLHLLGETPLYDFEEMRDAPTQAQFIALAQQMSASVINAVIGIRQLVDWARANTGLEVSVVGFSMSAIVASIAMGVDERISSGVYMMGAGNPGEVFATCNGKLEEVRESVTQRFGWTRERYRALFEALLAAGDPRNFAGRYDSRNILIIDGMFDGCMSREARTALWEATGRPERITFFANHKWSFLSLTPIALNMAGRKIHAFLSRHPQPDAEPITAQNRQR